jgi:ATP-dependent helicase/nuclease subunit A
MTRRAPDLPPAPVGHGGNASSIGIGANLTHSADPSDAAARRAAQTVFDRPLAIEAGAGTGKTTTLVARLLAWCLGRGWERARERLAGLPGGPERGGAAGAFEAAGAERTAAGVLSRVVAITFTEAAAAEMAGRAARELAALAAGGSLPEWLAPEAVPPAPERAERARALLATLDHLTVRTVHAFCLRLLAEHPLEAGVHPALQVDAEGRRLAEVAREAVEARLRQGYGDPGDPHLLALAADGYGPPEVEEALVALVQSGMTAAELASDPFGEHAREALAGRFAAACSVLHALLAPLLAGGARGNAGAIERALAALLRQLAPGAPGAGADAPGARISRAAAGEARAATPGAAPGTGSSPPLLALAELAAAAAEALPGNLREHLRGWGRGKFRDREWKLLGDVAEALAPRADELARLLDHLERLDPERLDHGRHALGPLAAAVERELARRGIATFDSLLTGAERLLARHPAVRAQVRRGIDQLLVDEFQDTDRVQCEVLRRIALEGPHEQRPGLFLVGDPKQSIYGWRSADLAAYDRFLAALRADGGEVLALTLNFRSVPAILDEVARVVAPVMRERPGLQPRFEPLHACPARQGELGFARGGRGAVEHWVGGLSGEGRETAGRNGLSRAGARDPSAGAAAFPAELEATSASPVELEAAAIAADLAALHCGEGVAWREMALLLRGTGNLEVYLDALRRAGVPFAVGRDKQHFRRREVIEAAALVRAVLDPGDHLALLTTLRSPAVGVPDAALVPLWRHQLPRRMTELLAPSPAALAAVAAAVAAAVRETPAVAGLERVRGWELPLLAAIEHLAVLRASFESEPADLFVERLRRLFLLDATAAARSLGSYRLANLERFFRRLLAAMEEGGGDVTTVLRALRAGVAEAQEAEEGRPQEGFEDAVSVLTIHGAKGLAFDHVYLAQMHKGPPPEAAPVFATGRTAEGSREYRLFGAPTAGFDRVEAERREVESAERVRLLYVAMTRARQRLVLSGLRPAAAPATPPPAERCRSHAELLLSRPDPPDLAAWRRDLRLAGLEARADAAGAIWRFLELAPPPAPAAAGPGAAHPTEGPGTEYPAAGRAAKIQAAGPAAKIQAAGPEAKAQGLGSDVEPRDGAGGPARASAAVLLTGPAEVAAASELLAARRAAAAVRMRRPFGAAASEEAHALLREQMAERWSGAGAGGEDAAAPGAAEPETDRAAGQAPAWPAGEAGAAGAAHREPATAVAAAHQDREPGLAARAAAAHQDRALAMAAGAALHRALESWDLDAEPRREMERQRLLLPAYLAALAPAEPVRALARAERLLARFAEGGLLAKLCALGPRVLARELAVLLPPGRVAGSGAVGFVAGSIDLLYRDAESGLPVVADYKTDEVRDPAELARRAAVYAPQGAAYVRAAAAALGADRLPRFELWFVVAGRVVELPVPAARGKLPG